MSRRNDAADRSRLTALMEVQDVAEIIRGKKSRPRTPGQVTAMDRATAPAPVIEPVEVPVVDVPVETLPLPGPGEMADEDVEREEESAMLASPHGAVFQAIPTAAAAVAPVCPLCGSPDVVQFATREYRGIRCHGCGRASPTAVQPGFVVEKRMVQTTGGPKMEERVRVMYRQGDDRPLSHEREQRYRDERHTYTREQ